MWRSVIYSLRLLSLCLPMVLALGCIRSGSCPKCLTPPPVVMPGQCRIPPNPMHPTQTDLSTPSSELKAIYAYAEKLEQTLAIARASCGVRP